VGYTPGRHVIVFERKPDWTENVTELEDLPVVETITENQYTRTFETAGDLICKTLLLFRDDAFSRVNIARMSPLSNGIVGAVHNRGKWMGWLEKKLRGRIFEAHENEIELFRLYCRHQIFLARNGYVDFDVTTFNFLQEECSGKLFWFDKNQVNPISMLEPEIYDLEIGWYFKYLKKGFGKIYERKDILKLISDAMATMDSTIIEGAFSTVLDMLSGETLNRRGADLFNAGDMLGARVAFLSAVEQNPELAVAHNNLGLLCCCQGKYKDALRHFQNAHELEPSDPVVGENMRKVREALKSIRNAPGPHCADRALP
jgi:tetratricopeptide (TPR) repeat protein